MINSEGIGQFIRFCLVGISNTLIYFFVYYLLLFFQMHYWWASFFGWAISVGNAYVWSRRFVFCNKQLNGMNSLYRIYVSYAMTLLLNMGGLYYLIDYNGISEKVAPWAIYVLTVPCNYFMNKYWVFSK